MKYFVHLKDDVVFASHQSSTEIDIPGDNIIEVPYSGDELLNKKYENGNFIDAPLIKYAVLDNDNSTVISIEKTFFISEVSGPIIHDSSVKVLSIWDGEKFNPPAIVEPVEIITV